MKPLQPKLQKGDAWGCLRVIAYEGHRLTKYTVKRKAHHYRMLCACGHEFTEPQSRLVGKNRMEVCGKCGNDIRMDRVREFYANEKAKPSFIAHWPAPGAQRGKC